MGELKSRFVTMASHEFRTPLSTILTSAYLLEKYNDMDEPVKREKHIQRIKTAVLYMRSILEDFLSLGKPEEGLIQATLVTVTTEECFVIIQSVINEMEPISKDGQKINVVFEGDGTTIIDKQFLKNIMMNLLSNASKFSPENSSILVEASAKNGHLQIAVKDNGIGISKEDLQHLFSRFFLAKNAANIQGTGLGFDNARQKGLMQLTSNESITYNYKKRQVLYNEGQKPKAVYYVISGKVKVYKTKDYGKELITNMFTAGDFLGYLPVLQDMNYSDNAEVLEDTEMMLIPRDNFKSLVTSDAQTAKEFIQLITHNMLEKEEDLVNLAYNTLRKKVAYGIVRLAEKYKSDEGKPTIINLSREDTAQSVGIATESLIRTLAGFKKEGLIDMQAGKMIILNENKLRNLPY